MKQIMIGSQMVAYEVIRKKIKHTYLRIVQNQLIITTNNATKEEDIRKFILKHEDKLHQRLTQEKKISLYSDQFMELFGVQIPLIIQNGKRNSLKILDNLAILTCTSQDVVFKVMERFYQKAVIHESEEFIKSLSLETKKLLPPDGIVIKSQLMKSRFGSCHITKKVIKLNSILGRFDKIYLHSTICHELVHFKIKGHQKDFYRKLSSLDPNYKQTNNELKKIVKRYEV